MNVDQAKLFLSVYRPGSEDDDDPQFAEALALARREPALMAWFNEQQSLDSAIEAKIDQVPVPADLADRILAGRPVCLPQPQPPRIPMKALAWAASFMLLAGVTGMLIHSASQSDEPATEWAAFQNGMAEYLTVFPRLDLETEHLEEVRGWLASRPALAQVSIPPGLTRFPSIGCRKVDWQGKEASLVCFMVDGEVVHLFMLPQSEWPGTLPDDAPQYAQSGAMTTATWRNEKEGVIFLALSKGNEAFLARYL